MPLAVHLDLAGLPAVVVGGGGAVGTRRARLLRDQGARVTVIDPAPVGTGFAHVAEPFRPAHLAGARLALACATPAVNAEVVAAAKARGVWVCDAAEPARGDFAFLASGGRGPVALAVGTSGASPALARRILDDLLGQLDPAMTDWVACLAELRPQVLASGLGAAARRELLTQFAGDDWGDRVRALGRAGALAAMRGLLAQAGGAVVGGADAPAGGVAGQHRQRDQPDAGEDAGRGGEVEGDREQNPERD